MFILVFSLLISSVYAFETFHTRLDQIYHPYDWRTTAHEGISDDTIEKIFEDAGKRQLLVNFRKDFRSELEKNARCTKMDKPLAREWLILANVEVDLVNLETDKKTSELFMKDARKAARAALECDVENQTARRLVRELKK